LEPPETQAHSQAISFSQDALKESKRFFLKKEAKTFANLPLLQWVDQ
jgi:hypothetical protein